MSFLIGVFDIVAHDPQAILYYLQAFAYALAFRAIFCGRHAPCAVYLASCAVHLALGLLHHFSHR